MKIKRCRIERGLTQAALARKVRIRRVHLANLESPDTVPHHRSASLAVLERLAKALGVPVTKLLADPRRVQSLLSNTPETNA